MNALAEINARALEALSAQAPQAAETANGFRHAAQILGSLPSRAMKHLAQHAGFTSSPAKAAAYREAAAILSRHTGQPDLTLPPQSEPEPQPAPVPVSPQGELFP